MEKNQPITKTPPRGIELLDNPNLNKGTAFTDEKRGQLGLVDLLPDSVEDIDRQLERVLGHLKAKQNDLERYIYLIGLCDRNETLFYKLLMSDPMRFLPIVYDPHGGRGMLEIWLHLSPFARYVRFAPSQGAGRGSFA
jgi:malate dehydrogenase (oxaloacetate-decarboxylating)(NADP+)